MDNIDVMLDGYIETALWSSLDDDNNSMDDNHSRDNLDPESDKEMRADCQKFLEDAVDLLEKIPDLDYSLVGHEFWLTRNHHGAGFWDSPERWGGRDNADALTDLANKMGERYLYVGDDETVYQSEA